MSKKSRGKRLARKDHWSKEKVRRAVAGRLGVWLYGYECILRRQEADGLVAAIKAIGVVEMRRTHDRDGLEVVEMRTPEGKSYAEVVALRARAVEMMNAACAASNAAGKAA